jgi:hypothetical protein
MTATMDGVEYVLVHSKTKRPVEQDEILKITDDEENRVIRIASFYPRPMPSTGRISVRWAEGDEGWRECYPHVFDLMIISKQELQNV